MMKLSPGHVAAGPATTNDGHASFWLLPSSFGGGKYSENWSSLIGIITAIVGNVLISFALNTQRYAHIRLEREWQEKERQRKRRSASYRTSQATSPGERADAKGVRPYDSPQLAAYTDEPDRLEEDAVATEADPLIPAMSPTQTSAQSHLRPGLEASAGDVTEEAYKQKSYLKSPYWWAGIILMTVGEAGNFLAYGFAPASIVSPLGVVALISNCIIAPFMLKEPVRMRDGLGVLVAVGGAVTVVASASDNNPKLGPDEIWDLIRRWEFETYLGITVAVIASLMVASNKFGDKNILIDLGLVGLFGGYTALSTKGVASMLSYTLWRAITFPVTYLLVAILAFTAIMQIKYVNRALQRFDATQVIPVQFVLFTLSVILGSAILYRDFERTSGQDAGKFVGGCALTFSGVWLITSGRPRSRGEDDEEEEDREPEPEDAINLVNGERYRDDVGGPSDEVASGSSRRTSTLRAKSPPLDIDRRDSITRRTSKPSTPLNSVSEHDSFHQNTSAILDTPASLIENPWEQESRGASDSPSRPPPATRHSTTSMPVLLFETTMNPTAAVSNPELPTGPLPPSPRTPTRGISDNAVPTTPDTSSTLPHHLRRMGTAERAGARSSIPGPLLASPLSTSLSAMVADLKRNGTRVPRDRDYDATARRRESVLGIGAGEVDERQFGELLNRRRTATDDVPSNNILQKNVSRQRSLSGTLSELWRGIRRGGEDRARERDIEQQRDGSEEGR